MQPIHHTCIQALARCTFLPGSYEKRFIRDAATWGIYDMLSPKQEAYIEKLAWRYRRQIGRALVPEPVKDVSREDLQALIDWNEGKPL